MNNFSLWTWIRNKIGDNLYYLVLDYDNQDKLTVVTEIQHLQKKFNLAEAQIVKTNNGFHVYYFYDNELSYERVLEILSESKAVDPIFVENFKNSKYVITRVSGKYSQRDIYPVDKISGREITLIEKSVWDSLKSLVIGQMNAPLIDNRDYVYDIPEYVPHKHTDEMLQEFRAIQKEFGLNIDFSWYSTPEEYKKQLQSIKEFINSKKNKEEQDETIGYVSEIKQEISQSQEEIPSEKIEVDMVWPKNASITEARKSWYHGNPFIARLISAAVENREVAFVKDNKIVKMIDELWAKTNKKYLVNDFLGARALFFSNSTHREKMEEVFFYNIEKTWAVKNPLAFFKSVMTYDMWNKEFSEIRKGVNLFNFAERKKLSAYMSKNIHKIITGYDIIFDFDCKDEKSTFSYDEARKLRDLLNKMMIPFSLNFSGNKWFHIRIRSTDINRVCPEFIEFLKQDSLNYKILFQNILNFAKENNIEIDPDLYNWDFRGLIRVEWSIHQATGSVVKPLKDSEFDELEGLSLLEIQEKFKPVNLLKWNFQQKIQRNEFVIRMNIDGMYMSWEELRDCGKYNGKDASGKTEWETVRADIINPIAKELRALSKEDPKKFAEVIAKGEYQGLLVEAPEYINLINGSNFDFSQTRKGNDQALREFVLGMIK